MAKAAKTRYKPLMLSPKALEKALIDSARRAQRLADAFGQAVPTLTSKASASPRKKVDFSYPRVKP